MNDDHQTSFFELISRGKPDQIALNTENELITYGELRKRICQFAIAIRQHGLEIGDRLVLQCGYDTQTVVSILGAIEAGIVVVPLHGTTPPERIKEICREVDARITVTSSIKDSTLSKEVNVYFKDSLLEKRYSLEFHEFIAVQDDLDTEDMLEKGELALIIYTSGSLGKSKGVMVSRSNILFTTKAIQACLHYMPGDRILSFLPLAFDYGLYQIFLSLWSQATLYLRSATIFTSLIHRWIESEQITVIPGMRHLFALICRGDSKFKSVRCVTNTGEGLPTSLLNKITTTFPCAEIYLMYGLTECKRVSILPYNFLYQKPGSVGLPLPGTKVVILDVLGNECPAGEVGQLVISGPHVCMGYWRMEDDQTFVTEGNKEKLLYTGDLFTQDLEGFLYFHSRMDDQFKHKGYRIDPVEIEDTILFHVKDVSDVAVVLVNEGQSTHEQIIASIVPVFSCCIADSSTLISQVLICCRQHLEPWKVPSKIMVFESFPVSLTGKVNRKQLKQIVKECEKHDGYEH